MKSAMIVVAHHDDEVLGCGGIISKLSLENWDIQILFVVEGRETQERDSLEAAKRLGINYEPISLNYPKHQLDQVPIVDIVKSIEGIIEIFKPDLLFTHDPTDLNQEHYLVYKAVMIATRPITPPYPKTILSFPVLSSQEYNYDKHFIGDTFVELSNYNVNLKTKALECYKSEIMQYPHPRSDRAIRAVAQSTGIKAGYEYAEEFRTIRRLGL